MCNFVSTFCIFHLRPKIAFSLSVWQVAAIRWWESDRAGETPSTAAQAAPTERSAPVLSSALCSRVLQ